MEQTTNNANPKYLWVVLAAVIAVAGMIFVFQKFRGGSPTPLVGKKPVGVDGQRVAEIKKFGSEQAFKDYVAKAKSIAGFPGGRGGGGFSELSATKSSEGLGAPETAAAPDRVSGTNVQTAGIDEPDSVKTDGKEIYFSTQSSPVIFKEMPITDCAPSSEGTTDCFPQPRITGGTKNIRAFPVSDLKIDGKIEKKGDLLLAGKTLIIIPSQRYYWLREENKIYGFDVSDPKNPKELWNIEMKEGVSVAGARLRNGKIYLATKTDIVDENRFCALEPLVVNGRPWPVRCADIFHPTAVVPADATYTAMIIDPQTGRIEKDISFVGSSDYTSSVVYMSENALYLTYYYPGDNVKILNSFLKENKDLVPDWFLEKLAKLEEYDISMSAKSTEIWNLIEKYQTSLSKDDRLKSENEIGNRMTDFLKKKRRELDSTGVVKIGAENLDIQAAGTVPGKLLNQFSMDEYKGDLRAATTVGQNFFGWSFGFGSGAASETANDVYILGDDLKIEGSVVDLGKGEQIYSVRFIADKGYVVTFRQVDPFYVLDLSDPMNPAKAGELKIPGYSSYLHPISKDRILGIGEENNKVKISLFDVSDPADPTEIAKYNLDEYYSEVSANHHAFLQDAKHNAFFLPGSNGGYVFSYAGDSLKLAKAVSDSLVKRAVYINDLLYVIGDNKLIVLDEKNWEKAGELEL
jgi:uncharacterized secreted protein with C-terminal beta-propeller domain